jgi:hypothetical protein
MFRAYRGLLDLVAVAVVAFVVLLPPPGVTVLHALPRAGVHDLDQIAELQTRTMSHPQDASAKLDLADLYLWQWRPDWALATLGPLAEQKPDDFRVHFAMAVAFADRFDFRNAKAAIDMAIAACNKNAGEEKCGEPDEVRMKVFGTAVGDVVAQGINPLNDPNRAKIIIDNAIHNAKIPKPGEEAHRLFPPPPKPKAQKPTAPNGKP